MNLLIIGLTSLGAACRSFDEVVDWIPFGDGLGARRGDRDWILDTRRFVPPQLRGSMDRVIWHHYATWPCASALTAYLVIRIRMAGTFALAGIGCLIVWHARKTCRIAALGSKRSDDLRADRIMTQIEMEVHTPMPEPKASPNP